MKRRIALGSLLVATCAALFSVVPVACSSSDDANAPGAGDASADGTTSSNDSAVSLDAGAPRSFHLASGGVQLVITGPELGLQITPADLATDVDIIEVHQEYYGVPWDAFAAGTPPPVEWTTKMSDLAATAKATNKPIFLSMTMLNGGRDSLAAKTTIDGQGHVQSTDHWATHCYDFATAPDAADMKKAYLAYVDYMIATFGPAYLNFAVEVNLFFENCPAATAGLVDLANAAYAEAKSKKSDVVAFPSIQIDHLYGYTAACAGGDAGTADRETCFEANFAAISPLKRDRFAMSTYPYGQFKSATDLPADWFSRGPAKNSEVPLIAETGWLSTPLVASYQGTCDTLFTFAESDEEAYLDFVLRSADTQKIDVVNWWSDRDLVVSSYMTDCPCTFDATWCAVLDAFRGPDGGPDAGSAAFFGELASKVFGTMGLRNYDGTEKPTVYGRWQVELARPLAK
jgi:hypothetical protein